MTNNLDFIDNLSSIVKDNISEYSKGATFVNIATEKFELEGLKVILDNYNYSEGVINIVLEGSSYTKGRADLESNIKENFRKKFLKDFNAIVPNIEAWTISEKVFNLLKNHKLNVYLYTKNRLHCNVFLFGKPIFNMYSWNLLFGSSCLTSDSIFDNIESDSSKEAVITATHKVEWFESIKENSMNISDLFLDILENNTWLRSDIYPYMVSMKLAYESLKEELYMTGSDFKIKDNGVKLFQYQVDAVASAKKILEKYNGVFISDVVGLGKSYIGAMLISQLDPDKTLVISPPKLIDKPWSEMLRDKFKMRKIDIESVGKIDNTESYIDDIEYIVIDEAHGFRNRSTNKFKTLKKLAKNKKIILITATPYNNKIDDIVNLIELFWNENSYKNSNVSLSQIKENQSLEWLYKNVLSNVVIRRTREDLTNYYADDLESQGIFFPKVNNPRSLEYKISEKYAQYYYDTLKFIQEEFTYSLYTSLSEEYIDESDLKRLSENDVKYALKIRDSQRKMSGLMKCLLFKRLESSKDSFESTITVIRTSINEKIKSIKNEGYITFTKNMDYEDYVKNISNIEDDDSDDDNLFNTRVIGNKNKVEVKLTIPVSTYSKLYADLQKDEANLDMLQRKWMNLKEDNKLSKLIDTLKEPSLSKSKIVLFTEYASTASYVNKILSSKGFNTILYTSASESAPSLYARSNRNLFSIIKKEFDVDYKEKTLYDDKQLILICTDMLSEGINLHKSNILINYDLPWNPVRIMQRLGRVNRIGSKSSEIFIMNFLPTLEGEEILELKGKISRKLSEFKQLLGDDNKYIDISEDVGSKKMFTVNNDSLDIKEESNPVEDLKWIFLKELRQLKGNNPSLYNSIVNLPENVISVLINNNEISNSLVLTAFNVEGDIKVIVNEVNKSTGRYELKDLSLNEALSLSLCYSNKPVIDRLSETRGKSDYMQKNKIKNRFDRNLFKRISFNIEYIMNKYEDKNVTILFSEHILSK